MSKTIYLTTLHGEDIGILNINDKLSIDLSNYKRLRDGQEISGCVRAFNGRMLGKELREYRWGNFHLIKDETKDKFIVIHIMQYEPDGYFSFDRDHAHIEGDIWFVEK